MKFLHTAAFAVILTVAGAPALCAQQPEQDKDKPKQQEEKKKQPPAKETTQPKPDERPKNEAKPDKDKEKPKPDMDKKNQQPREDQKANRQTQERQAPETSRHEQRGSQRNVRRIPEEHFRANFGREHHFRVERRDERHFQYRGYVFEYVEVWPSDWSYDDECYIEEDGDDYYLMNVRHPGVRILVVIVG
jgi:hypothetical protein